MDAWSIATPILVAVLVGALVPLLFQLAATLRATRRVVDRLDRITAKLEEGRRIDELAAAVDSLARAARQVGEGVRVASAVGAALGPAAAAAIHAWRDSGPAARRDGANGEGEEERP